MKPPILKSSLRLAAAAALAVTQAASWAADGYVTTNEAKLDAIFSQAGFAAADKIDIRFNSQTSIIDASLTSIDSFAEWDKMAGLAVNFDAPVVNMFFVDKVRWCGDPGTNIAGCADTPGNLMALDSSWAAHASLGGNLLGHELAHNLGLGHVLPNNGSNLMNPTLSTSFALTAAQITTILSSALVQSDAQGKFITIQPIAVLAAAPVPEPSTWAMLLLGGVLLVGATRGRRSGLGQA